VTDQGTSASLSGGEELPQVTWERMETDALPCPAGLQVDNYNTGRKQTVGTSPLLCKYKTILKYKGYFF
jgi:hypothetical protein